MEKYAVVDIGSNTVRLCIYKAEKKKKGYKYDLLLNMKESVRLRREVVNNKLTEEGIRKLKDILRVFRAIIKKDEIEHFRYIGTQTIRMIDNQAEVLKIIKDKFDIDIEVITGEEEAITGFIGMHSFLKHVDEGLYVDLGGGSCEVVHFKKGTPLEFFSFDFGSIVLRTLVDKPVPTDVDIKLVKEYITNKFTEVEWLKDLNVPLIVVGGSARNMVRIDKFLTKRNNNTHGYECGFREISRIRKILMLLSLDEIEKIQGFTKSRADIIVSSIYVFEELYKYIDADYFVCSRTGLREGVLVNMIGDNYVND